MDSCSGPMPYAPAGARWGRDAEARKEAGSRGTHAAPTLVARTCGMHLMGKSFRPLFLGESKTTGSVLCGASGCSQSPSRPMQRGAGRLSWPCSRRLAQGWGLENHLLSLPWGQGQMHWVIQPQKRGSWESRAYCPVLESTCRGINPGVFTLALRVPGPMVYQPRALSLEGRPKSWAFST